MCTLHVCADELTVPRLGSASTHTSWYSERITHTNRQHVDPEVIGDLIMAEGDFQFSNVSQKMMEDIGGRQEMNTA